MLQQPEQFYVYIDAHSKVRCGANSYMCTLRGQLSLPSGPASDARMELAAAVAPTLPANRDTTSLLKCRVIQSDKCAHDHAGSY